MVEPRTTRTTRTTRVTRSADDGKQSSARRAAADGENAESRGDAPDSKSNTNANTKARPRKPTLDARRAAALAADHVRELTGKAPEGVTGLERLDDGWRVGIEVLESRRIPDSIDLLAVYSVELDGHGELVGYRREQRYHRGRPEERS